MTAFVPVSAHRVSSQADPRPPVPQARPTELLLTPQNPILACISQHPFSEHKQNKKQSQCTLYTPRVHVLRPMGCKRAWWEGSQSIELRRPARPLSKETIQSAVGFGESQSHPSLSSA